MSPPTIDWDSGKSRHSRLQWATRWSDVMEWNAPFARWFPEGTINAAVNCVDRHVAEGRGDRIAFHFEGEPGDTRTITYAQLLAEVCKAANALTALGVQKGDRVAIYLPMIPEAVISMLACARIGAPHSVIFGGFSAQAIYDRVVDADAKLVITADGGYRRGSPSALKPAVDEALGKGQTNVSHVLVVRRTGGEVPWNDGLRHLVARIRRHPAERTLRPRHSTQSIRSSSSTHRGPPGSRRASCTQPAGT